MSPKKIENAALRYLTAQQVHRDALRLLEIGRSAASKEHREVLEQVIESEPAGYQVRKLL